MALQTGDLHQVVKHAVMDHDTDITYICTRILLACMSKQVKMRIEHNVLLAKNSLDSSELCCWTNYVKSARNKCAKALMESIIMEQGSNMEIDISVSFVCICILLRCPLGASEKWKVLDRRYNLICIIYYFPREFNFPIVSPNEEEVCKDRAAKAAANAGFSLQTQAFSTAQLNSSSRKCHFNDNAPTSYWIPLPKRGVRKSLSTFPYLSRRRHKLLIFHQRKPKNAAQLDAMMSKKDSTESSNVVDASHTSVKIGCCQ